ncbi:MAG: hypothetical protein UU08_C0017G0004 [Candidatus Uhrbacteria bacterium GW2011_GWE2_40_58]|nr:MAG: hypothetical protein UT94_C0019G0004 [Candidatus Uhrbacteria bacterium GW2011_GWF2_40_263]KKR67445.1 MAG: hypothetical protein UU08_C0017G0004 [Candidatus Uhrbacteria bacterium GW2011_GWE2_40_58]OGL94452.1 MAG: hypothetical protein A2239_01170 [Candidatus Uhrbacteria bacterium RIFOXYA2_FULL_40_9]OGL98284.1 MAG: hypothetical protein A2332_05005 [Candidatus Uhrbacteria bacterium RIFOXYB2_FULL_41_18]HCB55696.1 hypothetical protein [Candidatus Uhrbacteria bacterium]
MQRLNIPLQSRSRTTRRVKRRVVWLFIFLFIFFLSILWILSRNWFTTDTLSQTAPESTVLMLRFTPNQQTWKNISELLGDFPLISNRGITVKDIQEYTEGEFALFIQENGTRSLAIHSSDSKLPRDLLDSHHITIQKISDSVFLLSEKLMPISGFTKKGNHQYDFIHFGHKMIGTAYFSVENTYISGPILLSKNDLQITLPPVDITPLNFEKVPENIIAILSTPAWPFSDPSTLSYDIMSLFTSENTSQIDQFIDSVINKQGTIILSSNEQQLQFLITTKQEDADLETLLQRFKMLASLQNPQVSNWQIQDGTILKELTIDPSRIALETIMISGNPIYRYPINEGEYLYLSNSEKATIFSNNEELLRFWFTKELDTSSTNISLLENALFLNLEAFSEIFMKSSTFKQSSSLFQIQKMFSSIGIDAKKRSLSLIFHRN